MTTLSIHDNNYSILQKTEFYALIVFTFILLSSMEVSVVAFFIPLIVIAVSSSPLESLINTLVSSTKSVGISTVIVSFNYIGGGIGYILAS